MKLLNYLLVFMLLFGINLLPIGYSQNNTTSKMPRSVQEVESICLGQITGDPAYKADFEKYLKDQIQEQGFAIGSDKSQCDAILSGHIKVYEYQRSFWKSKQEPGKIVAWAIMKLTDKNSTALWKDEFKPYYSVKNPDYIKNDGRSGLAANIAKRLKEAKQSSQ